MEKALLDDQAAGHDLFADMAAQAIDRAISVPGDIGVKFERMAAGRIAQKLFFPAQALQMIRFSQGNRGKTIEVFEGHEAELALVWSPGFSRSAPAEFHGLDIPRLCAVRMPYRLKPGLRTG